MKIFIIFLLFFSLNCIEEIEYRIVHRIIARVLDKFSVKFNKTTGITAEYEEYTSINEIDETLEGPTSKGKKLYNLTSEDLGLPSLKDLFKLFNKISFPEETNWTDKFLYDIPIWHLIVDGKDYYSNVGTEFKAKFNEIVNVYNIMTYCKDNYK